MAKEKLKMVKLTKEQIIDRKTKVATMEMEGEISKVRIKHFKKRLASGLVKEEGLMYIKGLKEEIKRLQKVGSEKESLASLKQLETLSALNDRNVKALRLQLKTGMQPDFTKPLQ